MPQDVEQNYIY